MRCLTRELRGAILLTMRADLLTEVRTSAAKRTKVSMIRFAELEWEDVVAAAKEAGVPVATLAHHAVVKFARECLNGNREAPRGAGTGMDRR